jgi:ribonuclease HI
MHYPEIIINTDGGARGNPGPAAVGITARAGTQTLFEISEYIGEQTNNVAEYTAVIHALTHLDQHHLSTDTLIFILDSELIVRQITGQYKVKQPHLQQLVNQVRSLISKIKNNNPSIKITFQNVLRGENKRADQLVNQALDSHSL